MTISSTNRKAGPYAGNDVAVDFPFSFKVFGATDLFVVRADSFGTESTLTLTTDYTVALNSNQDANPGGTVTLLAPLASAYTLTVTSALEYLQTTDLTNQGGFYPKVITNALDRLTIFCQQLAENIGRAALVPLSSTVTTRANTVVGFDTTGNAVLFPAQAGTPLADLAAATGAALIGYSQVGTGAQSRTVQARLREISSRSDYDTLANFWAATTYAPKFDPTTGKAWWNTDPSALNYSTSRAGYVWQHRDNTNGATNELIPGAVFQFNSTGNGTVTAGSELSQTVWQGLYSFHNKSGDGSAHCFTAIGQLSTVGVGGYNELGLFQGEGTNTGSVLGTMSGVEMLLKDSPDGGSTSYSTKMQAIVGRLAKYNNTTRKSYNFYAGSEGALPPDGILGINPSGLYSWQRGIDFQGAVFTTGQWSLAPNNTAMAWLDASGNAQPIIGVSDLNATYLRPASAAATLDLQDFAGTTRMQVTGAGAVAFLNQTLSAGATAGANGAPPAQVSGYVNWTINGSSVMVPYYNP